MGDTNEKSKKNVATRDIRQCIGIVVLSKSMCVYIYIHNIMSYSTETLLKYTKQSTPQDRCSLIAQMMIAC